jgi:hypothetical protein
VDRSSCAVKASTCAVNGFVDPAGESPALVGSFRPGPDGWDGREASRGMFVRCLWWTPSAGRHDAGYSYSSLRSGAHCMASGETVIGFTVAGGKGSLTSPPVVAPLAQEVPMAHLSPPTLTEAEQ